MDERKRPKLAPRVYWKHGAYFFVTAKNKWVRLGVTEQEAYAALAELNAPSRNMAALFDRYTREVLPKKALQTQKQYKRLLVNLRLAFGHMDPKSVEPHHIAALHDAIGKDSPVSANRHVAVLSAVFKLGVRSGAVRFNPCHRLGRFEEAPRSRYVTDQELAELLARAPAWLADFMEFEHLTGQRESNLLRMPMSALQADGIHFPAQKRGKPIIVEWSPDLKALCDRAKARREALAVKKVVPMQLLLGKYGGPITVSGLQSGMRRLWQAYRTECEKTPGKVPVAHFTLHDLRAKAGSETGDDRMLGHQNPATFRRIYMRKPTSVRPTK